MGRRRGGVVISERLKPLGLGWPNLVSVLRVLLIPLIIALIARRTAEADWVAVAVFVLGAMSDGLDGYLARRHSMTTHTGAWLDPLSDKLFVAGPAIALSTIGRFPWWATVAIVAREVAITFLRWRLDTRSVSMPASKVAKAKTAAQLLAVGMAMAPLNASLHSATLAVAFAAVALTLYTGAEYFLTSTHRVNVD
jgi:CDP-diacylglycerol---glycerol-3-phosphate 3-phosphatidyltransferase